MKTASLLAFAGATTWKFVSRLIAFIIFGIVLNIILFVLLPKSCPLAADATLGEKLSQCTLSVLLGVLFLVGFPILYAILGYKSAIQNALYHVYVQNKDLFFNYLSEKFFAKLSNQTLEKIDNINTVSQRFFDKLDNLPFVFRNVSRHGSASPARWVRSAKERSRPRQPPRSGWGILPRPWPGVQMPPQRRQRSQPASIRAVRGVSLWRFQASASRRRYSERVGYGSTSEPRRPKPTPVDIISASGASCSPASLPTMVAPSRRSLPRATSASA